MLKVKATERLFSHIYYLNDRQVILEMGRIYVMPGMGDIEGLAS